MESYTFTPASAMVPIDKSTTHMTYVHLHVIDLMTLMIKKDL